MIRKDRLSCGCDSAVEYLHSKCEALDSIPSATKRKKEDTLKRLKRAGQIAQAIKAPASRLKGKGLIYGPAILALLPQGTLRQQLRLGMVMCTCNASTWAAETGGSLQV